MQDGEALKQEGEAEAYEADPVKVNQELVDEIEAGKRMNKMSFSRRGPCLSGAYDPVTGKTFFGENFDMGSAKGREAFQDFKNNASQVIKDRIAARERAIKNGEVTPNKSDGTPGAHAEVVAMDKAIKAREAQTEKPVTEADMGSFDLHNRSMSNNRPNMPMDRCSNCGAITNGTTVHGHN